MVNIALQQRKFSLKLAPLFVGSYQRYIFYLKRLLQRLGQKQILPLWNDTFINYNDKYMNQIISTGWKQSTRNGKELDEKELIEKFLLKYFKTSVEGVSSSEVQDLVEATPPIPQIRKNHASINVEKYINAYETIHLREDAVALLAESLIKRYGKQGEFMIYDIERERRTPSNPKPCSFTEFVKRGRNVLESPEPNFLNCAVDAEIISDNNTEHIMHIKQCENARYFHEHHPQVGYLIGCSQDEFDPKIYNKNIQLQRTSTIMEGGKICDFRYYLIKQAD